MPSFHGEQLELPTFATELVEQLVALYPARCIAPGESIEAAHRYAGKRELVDELIAAMQRTPTRVSMR